MFIYFNVINCADRNNCEVANTIACNNCARNKKPLYDNFKSKLYTQGYLNQNNNADVCDRCSCNPKNGGSGICNCTLNLPQIR